MTNTGNRSPRCILARLRLTWFLARAKIIRPSPHPSPSAGHSHSLSVFHHSISKPDPHVKPVPSPPPPLAPANRDLSSMAFQICNFLTHRLQSRGNNGGADRLGIVSGTNTASAPFTPPLSIPLFDIIFQLSPFAPGHLPHPSQ